MKRPVLATETAPHRLASHLVQLYAQVHEAKPGKAQQIAQARFDGYTEAAFIMIGAHTPFAVHMDVLEAWRANGPRPAFEVSTNEARKAWDKAMIQHVLNAWFVDGSNDSGVDSTESVD